MAIGSTMWEHQEILWRLRSPERQFPRVGDCPHLPESQLQPDRHHELLPHPRSQHAQQRSRGVPGGFWCSRLCCLYAPHGHQNVRQPAVNYCLTLIKSWLVEFFQSHFWNYILFLVAFLWSVPPQHFGVQSGQHCNRQVGGKKQSWRTIVVQYQIQSGLLALLLQLLQQLPGLGQGEVCLCLAGQPGCVGSHQVEHRGHPVLHWHVLLTLAPPLPPNHLFFPSFRNLLVDFETARRKCMSSLL